MSRRPAAAHFFVVGFWISMFLTSALRASPILTYDKSKASELLGPYLEVYRSPSAHAQDVLQASDLEWARSKSDVPSFGFDDKGTVSYWVRFQIANTDTSPVEVFLANHYPPTDYIRLYERGPDQRLALIEEQGDRLRYNSRSVQHRFPVFRVTLTPGTHTFYMEQASLGAIQFPLKVWRPDAFEEFARHENLVLGAIIGICGFVLLYNLFIFVRLKARVYLFYVVHNFTLCIYLSNFLGFTQSILLPDVMGSWWLTEGAKINMDILHLTALAFTIVFLDIKQNAPRLYRYLLGLMACGILTLFNTLTWKLWFNNQTAIFSLSASVSVLCIGFYLSKRFTFARYYTLGWSFFLILNIGTIFSLLGVTATNINLISWGQSIGHCMELCLLSLALGERIAWINRNREETLLELNQTKSDLVSTEQERVRIQAHLLDEREHHIQDLDRKVEERTLDLRSILNTINQGIFAIRLASHHCLMDPDYSPFLHSILGSFDCTKDDPVDLLFRDSTVGHDDHSRIRSIIISMMDCERLAFELNMSALPREIQRKDGQGQNKILEIDWDPIVDIHGNIRKLLVAVRDVTEYRALRSQVISQNKDIEIVRDLLQGGSSSHNSRIARIVTDLEDLLQAPRIDDAAVLRRLHSLKGDSRTLHLKALSEAIHNTEACWLQDQRNPAQGQELLSQAHALSRRYYDICRTFERRFRSLAVTHENTAQQPFQTIRLAELLAAEMEQMPYLARDLGKTAPSLKLDAHDLALAPDQADALRECFGHLLRNAMDHGLESPDVRRNAGKPEPGCIQVQILEHQGCYEFIFDDDGQGLHLDKLRHKARALGLNPHAEDDEAAAALIFIPELSTKDEASIISGRGIGMDAVRDRLTSMGGSIEIRLLPGEAKPGYRLFSLHIRVPVAHGLDFPQPQRQVS
ncbi:MAG TPA: 7TM diverse intracellular signaling domain-containing protein [Oligoflexus sp.]|uniref:7TM diverse intracellular signaling domain-containing protein n=1 Tax=Oligoflexus sp. TaxID=1971216 RepID=UPI002D49D73E|nr:7TM diverse intracellular signaling domain-containing protein [Oligoflexus sp.]HYX39577.1 7TM diverse intracellular signaling domain-containing protein [Oligoflexus sp.]